ncbi:MAG: hypothetical protein JRH16_21470 [Deltaproteobacteria bacterium]|nr:hypothetical protein [Deltaproteobacteria bacterium]
MTIHGALVSVRGVGVLLLGSSGAGKSECALELISRGHRLVADDVVELHVSESGALLGRSPERIRHHLEIRGLGILYVPDLYGPDRVLDETGVDLVCRIERWRAAGDFDRVGLDPDWEELCGVKRPKLLLPARPGASMATIVEVAALEHRRRQLGGESAARRLDTALRRDLEAQ